MAIAHSMLKDTVFLHRENIKQILLYVFSSYFFIDNFPKKIHPKCAPDRSISISKMQKLLRLGGGTSPSQTLPPLGRFAPSLAFSLQYCKSYPPLTRKCFALAPPDNRHLLRPSLPHPAPPPCWKILASGHWGWDWCVWESSREWWLVEDRANYRIKNNHMTLDLAFDMRLNIMRVLNALCVCIFVYAY